jgi:hypothetical protein
MTPIYIPQVPCAAPIQYPASRLKPEWPQALACGAAPAMQTKPSTFTSTLIQWLQANQWPQALACGTAPAIYTKPSPSARPKWGSRSWLQPAFSRRSPAMPIPPPTPEARP